MLNCLFTPHFLTVPLSKTQSYGYLYTHFSHQCFTRRDEARLHHTVFLGAR